MGEAPEQRGINWGAIAAGAVVLQLARLGFGGSFEPVGAFLLDFYARVLDLPRAATAAIGPAGATVAAAAGFALALLAGWLAVRPGRG